MSPVRFPPRQMRVYCSQFVQCRWTGHRTVSQLGVQPKPCPQCGREVVT